MLLKSRASPDMLPFSLCKKKRLAIRHMSRPLFPTTLSVPSYDIGKYVGLRTYQHPLVSFHREEDKLQNNIDIPPETCFSMAHQSLVGQGLRNIEASRSHSDTPHSVGLLWTSDQPGTQTSTLQHTTLRRHSNLQSQQACDCRPTHYKRFTSHKMTSKSLTNSHLCSPRVHWTTRPSPEQIGKEIWNKSIVMEWFERPGASAPIHTVYVGNKWTKLVPQC